MNLPVEVLRQGMKLPINVYVHLPQNETILHYRKVGDVLGAEDIAFFSKVRPNQLLVLKTESKKLVELGIEAVKSDAKKGDIHSPAVKKSAAVALQSLSTDPQLAETIEAASALVLDLIKHFKASPSVAAYNDAMKKTLNEKDILTLHHHQVSSISVLMALTIGDFSMDDLSDLAAAGLLHDIGLRHGTQSFIEAHVNGHNQISPQEKLIYIRHIDLTIERIKKENAKITPGIQRIIELHHENWDGSGFRNYSGNKIYRPARLMRIADDAVTLIQGSKQSLKFEDVLKKLAESKGMYDPDLMKVLTSSISASA